MQWPYEVSGGYRSDLPGRLTDDPLPFLVPAVDSDGNETSGILLPEVAVPLGTYTGWAFRSVRAGAPSEIIMMAGTYVPFARTRAEWREWNDPRPSVEERYPGRAEYLRRFDEAAQLLVEEGYLLSDDLQRGSCALGLADGAELRGAASLKSKAAPDRRWYMARS